MKKNLFVLFVLLLNQPLLAQNKASVVESEITMPINFEINLDLAFKKDKMIDFKEISQNKITKSFNLLKLMGGDDTKSTSDFYIRFGKATFGNSEKTVLIIRHKLKKSVSYKAKIKVNGKYVKTSVVMCHPNVASIEQWNGDIEEIQLYDFEYSKE
jgi:hypothetical protein